MSLNSFKWLRSACHSYADRPELKKASWASLPSFSRLNSSNSWPWSFGQFYSLTGSAWSSSILASSLAKSSKVCGSDPKVGSDPIDHYKVYAIPSSFKRTFSKEPSPRRGLFLSFHCCWFSGRGGRRGAKLLVMSSWRSGFSYVHFEVERELLLHPQQTHLRNYFWNVGLIPCKGEFRELYMDSRSLTNGL